MTSGRTSRKRKGNALVRGGRGPSTGTIVALVVLVLFAGVVGFGIYRAQHPAQPGTIPQGGTDSGIAVGSPNAPATVDIYLDFQCPVCKEYEQQTGSTIDELVAAGQARIVYHPVAFLDRYSSTRYSSRSSAASACAADAGVFPALLKLLYANQPPENGDGLPAEQLVDLGRQAGAGDAFAACVDAERYAGWTAGVTDSASRAGVTGTPTVKVNGVEIDRTAQALRDAVGAARK